MRAQDSIENGQRLLASSELRERIAAIDLRLQVARLGARG